MLLTRKTMKCFYCNKTTLDLGLNRSRSNLFQRHDFKGGCSEVYNIKHLYNLMQPNTTSHLRSYSYKVFKTVCDYY